MYIKNYEERSNVYLFYTLNLQSTSIFSYLIWNDGESFQPNMISSSQF